MVSLKGMKISILRQKLFICWGHENSWNQPEIVSWERQEESSGRVGCNVKKKTPQNVNYDLMACVYEETVANFCLSWFVWG